MTLNQFHVTYLLQCPLKTSGNLWFFDIFQEVSKNISVMKWVKDIFNKYFKVLIFMLVPQQSMLSYSRSALALSMHSRGIKFLIFSDLSLFQVTPLSDCFW